MTLIGVSQESMAQACQYGSSVQDASKLCRFIQGNSFASNRDAESALNKILNATGMSRRFVLLPCTEIENCMAASYKGTRYILYDPDFMTRISGYTSDWSGLSILAHEIGHHVNGHAVDALVLESSSARPPSLAESREMELEADRYSGFVMHKLGATLQQAQQAIQALAGGGDDRNSTHPTKYKRLEAIAEGYMQSKSQGSTYSGKATSPEEDLFYEGYALYSDEDYKGAIEKFDKVLLLNNKYADAYFFRGVAKHLWFEWGRSSEENRAIEESAIEDLTKYIAIDPNEPYAYYWRAAIKGDHILFRLYEEAIEDLTKGIALNPKDAELFYYERGLKYQRIKENRKAVEDFTKCIATDSSNEDYFYERAESYSRFYEYEKAEEDYSEAIRINPKNTSALENRGQMRLHYNQDYYGAISDFTSCIELRHIPSIMFEYRAAAKLKLGDDQGALEDLAKRAHVSGGKSTIGFTTRASANLNLGNYQTALEDVNNAIEFQGRFIEGNPEILVLRAKVHLALGDRKSARSDYDTAIKYYRKGFQYIFYGELANVYADRAELKLALSDTLSACEDFDEALAHFYPAKEYQKVIDLWKKIRQFPCGELSREFGYRAAKSYTELGDLENALEVNNWFVKNNPSDIGGYLDRAEFKLRSMDDKNGACDDLSKAIELGFDEERGLEFFKENCE